MDALHSLLAPAPLARPGCAFHIPTYLPNLLRYLPRYLLGRPAVVRVFLGRLKLPDILLLGGCPGTQVLVLSSFAFFRQPELGTSTLPGCDCRRKACFPPLPWHLLLAAKSIH